MDRMTAISYLRFNISNKSIVNKKFSDQPIPKIMYSVDTLNNKIDLKIYKHYRFPCFYFSLLHPFY